MRYRAFIVTCMLTALSGVAAAQVTAGGHGQSGAHPAHMRHGPQQPGRTIPQPGIPAAPQPRVPPFVTPPSPPEAQPPASVLLPVPPRTPVRGSRPVFRGGATSEPREEHEDRRMTPAHRQFARADFLRYGTSRSGIVPYNRASYGAPGAAEGPPDCSRMRGIQKSECERRDTVRDDLPAGVTPGRLPPGW